MQDALTLMAVGDVSIDREDARTIFSQTRTTLRSADIIFAQLEQIISDKGKRNPVALQRNRCNPETLTALLHAGVNVVSLAGNHSLAWGPEGLLDSVARLRDAGISVVGVGANIAEARKPVIVERSGTRIAFLGYCSVGPDGYEADERWPGYAPLRAWTHYEKIDFQPGTPPLVLTFPHDEDLAAMLADIKRAREQADLVVLSVHWGVHNVPAVIPMYEFKAAHAAIDAGVDLVLGHHTHLLKGIEVYKGKAIFHNLGNFACDTAVERVLKEFQTDVRRPFLERTRKLYKRGVPEMRRTMIAKVRIDDRKIVKVSYLPCYINERKEPEVLRRDDPRHREVVDYVEQISRTEDLDTQFRADGDEVAVEIA